MQKSPIKDPIFCKRYYILQKIPIILRSLLIVATIKMIKREPNDLFAFLCGDMSPNLESWRLTQHSRRTLCALFMKSREREMKSESQRIQRER